MMIYLLLIFVVEVILLNVYFLLTSVDDVYFYSWLFVFVNAICVIIYLVNVKCIKYKSLVVVAFLLRIILLIADIYQLFPIPHSGADSEKFHFIASMNQLRFDRLRSTNYTDFLTLVYSFTNSSRIIAQYINVLFGLGIVIMIEKTMDLLKVDIRSQKRVIAFASLIPHVIIFSAILLREAWVEFFIILSVFNFVKWFVRGNIRDFIFAIVFVLFSAYMHSGALCVSLGYIVAFLTYNPNKNTVVVSKSIIVKILFIVAIVLLFFDYIGFFIEKIDKLNSKDDFVEIVNASNEGGSAYLQWINASSWWQGILFSPLKIFYFQFSPLPMDWRGLNDLLAFLLDSVVYMLLFLFIIKNLKRVQGYNLRKKRCLRYLVISFFTTLLVFSYGTFNSGTALRHRTKLTPILLVIYAATIQTSRTKKEE